MAAAALLEKKVKRIVLARPAVEAGERLGFLPGDSSRRSTRTCGRSTTRSTTSSATRRPPSCSSAGIIEVAPIAFMRGRTLNDAFIILDEAQNTTSEQMKMFLTRIGFGSKAVVTGRHHPDRPAPGQDLGPARGAAGPLGIEGIRFVLFDERDVVRHPLVQSIITAYDALDREREAAAARARGAARASGR